MARNLEVQMEEVDLYESPQVFENQRNSNNVLKRIIFESSSLLGMVAMYGLIKTSIDNLSDTDLLSSGQTIYTGVAVLGTACFLAGASLYSIIYKHKNNQ